MKYLYKLTNQQCKTHGGYLYGKIGSVHTKPKQDHDYALCSSDVFHAYSNPNLAFLMNPIHAEITNPRLWLVLGNVVVDNSLKVGSSYQLVVRELATPDWVGSSCDLGIRVRFARLCVAAGYTDAAARNARHAARHARYAIRYADDARYARYADAAAYYAAAAADAADTASYAVGKFIDFGELADQAVFEIKNHKSMSGDEPRHDVI
jgi:hypothetical protein